MITAYETEGHGLYWQVFDVSPRQGLEVFLAEVETLDEVMKIARQKKVEVKLFTQEWYIKQEQESA